MKSKLESRPTMRYEIASVLTAILIFAVIGVSILTIRYHRYERRLARGSRNSKRPWKPFWMN
ncbi:hypothetical protein GRI89_11800 [Altererythrobacter salegens]|uniref:Uncharacterized protein n=2 Tax=Croceibacterium salegens TaxID=1737568 RepID=A0A6I4SWL7_9SPHN|nr:hypothetical protein [Croceibacterium salegens]